MDIVIAGTSNTRRQALLRRTLVASILLILAQAGLGMGVNLYAIVHAARSGLRAATAWTVLGGSLVVGAGFNAVLFTAQLFPDGSGDPTQ